MTKKTRNAPPLDCNSIPEVDVLVVGSGAAGLTAALRLCDLGMRSLVIEKASSIGGTSCYSGGTVWIPNNHVAKAAASNADHTTQDSAQEALRYLEATVMAHDAVESSSPATSPTRLNSFVTNGSLMIAFLERVGFRWRLCKEHPDCFAELPGGRMTGRTLEPELFDMRCLGEWRGVLRKPHLTIPPIYCDEARFFMLLIMSIGGWLRLIQALLVRWVLPLLIGKRNVTMGQALVGKLLYLCFERQDRITIRRNFALQRLVVSTTNAGQKEIRGAVVKDMNTFRETFIPTACGIVLCAGGFAANQSMRDQYLSQPTRTEWSLASADDQGDAIKAGIEVGAKTALMNFTWSTPVILNPATGAPKMLMYERSTPHCLIVDGTGQRFVNEATQYCQFVNNQYAQHNRTAAIPAWMILDTRNRNRYPLGLCGPNVLAPMYRPPSSTVVSAKSLAELAKLLKIPELALERTVREFNTAISTGHGDPSFHRGLTAYEQYYAPGGTLGTLEYQPFYAVAVYPGDIGTRGGLLTDDHARVIGQDGNVICGLYAAGNTAALWMGGAYPGQGSTLGLGLTAAFVAATNMAEETATDPKEYRGARATPEP